jgi:hypothetical protein
MHVDIGYSNIKTPYGDKIDLLSSGVGLCMGLGQDFFIGFTTEYKALSKFNGSQNLKLYKSQKELSLEPMIGMQIDSWIFKLSSPVIGHTVLSQTKDNLVTESQDPKGITITILKRFSPNWAFGSSYTTTNFQTVKVENEEDREQSLRDSSRILTASFILSYIF